MQSERRYMVYPSLFFIAALIGLAGALIFGEIASLQFMFPGFLHDFGFVRSRPIHVALAVAWIFLSAVGGIYYYTWRYHGVKWQFPAGPLLQLIIVIVTGVAILTCYSMGIFGGREYWEHPQFFAIPIVISWLLLVINFFRSIRKIESEWPLYLWMWMTGIVFFLVTFLESNLWYFPYFRDHIIRDLTVQWKSYGALVGSWNMMVYGTATFLVTRITGDRKTAHSRTAFLLYFLGFTNLLFGWAHHTYTLPNASWIRNVSYAISMSELLILAKLLWGIRRTVEVNERTVNFLPARFLWFADIWTFLNIILALAISVPAINMYTHGTHITVAHAMGSSIGINSMILLASITYAAYSMRQRVPEDRSLHLISYGSALANLSLVFFWIGLIWAGIEKSYHMICLREEFHMAMDNARGPLLLFVFSGIGLAVGMLMVIVPLVRQFRHVISQPSIH